MSDSFPTSTSHAAGQQAARRVGQWREKIIARLREQPSTLFEVAAFYKVPDHTISGRFTALHADGLIEHAGDRRRKPETGCEAEVWRITRAPAPPPDAGPGFAPMSAQAPLPAELAFRPDDGAA